MNIKKILPVVLVGSGLIGLFYFLTKRAEAEEFEPEEGTDYETTPEGKYKCLICEKEFDSLTALATHMLIDHAVKPREYKCYLCGAKFTSQLDLNRHIINKHPLTTTVYADTRATTLFPKETLSVYSESKLTSAKIGTLMKDSTSIWDNMRTIHPKPEETQLWYHIKEPIGWVLARKTKRRV